MNNLKRIRAVGVLFVLLTSFGTSAFAQSSPDPNPSYYFTTLAGGGYVDGTGTAARFNSVQGIAVDRTGTVYVADAGASVIRKITPGGVVTAFVGFANAVGSADGQGSAARFNRPSDLVVDATGNIFVSDEGNGTIRKITPAGIVSTLAGSAGHQGIADGTGTSASFSSPEGLALDAVGNLYVVEPGRNLIRKVTPGGVVTTIAGTLLVGSTDGAGPVASFYHPIGVAVDSVGNVYVADAENECIRKIASDGMVSTYAGQAGNRGHADGDRTGASFWHPDAIVADGGDNLFIADTGNGTIRKITAAGMVSTVAGLDNHNGYVDGVGAAARFSNPIRLAVDTGGTIYVSDSDNWAVRKITPAGEVSTFAGLPLSAGGNDGANTGATFVYPSSLVVDSSNTIYLADAFYHSVRKVAPDGVVTTIAGSPFDPRQVDGMVKDARFNYPFCVAIDHSGNLLVVDSYSPGASSVQVAVRKITPAGVVTTLSAGYTLPSLSYQSSPSGLVIDDADNLYISDEFSGTIRKITPTGDTTIFAGSAGNFDRVDGTGGAARFNFPVGLATDGHGILYVADWDRRKLEISIRKITLEGVVTTVAVLSERILSRVANSGDFARVGLGVDRAGYVVLVTPGIDSNLIRRISPAGTVTVVGGHSGDYGNLEAIGGAAFDLGGNLYVTNGGILQKGVPFKAADAALNFTLQPTSVTTAIGGSSIFSAKAAGTSSLSYQWQKDGTNIPGATSPSYAISTTGKTDAGRYTVVAMNDSGVIVSAGATLTVAVVAPNQISGKTVTTGHSVTFSAGNVSGLIQWQVSTDNGVTWTNLLNDTIYSGVNTTTLTLTNVMPGANGQLYRFQANDGNVVSTSNSAALAVAPVFFPFPSCIAADRLGNLYVGDAQANTVQKINASRQVSLIAGANGTAGSTDGAGAAARFNQLSGIATLASGALVVADTANGTVRKISTDGTVTTLAGSPANRGSADGVGANASFSAPMGMAVTLGDALLVTDATNDLVRKIATDGTVTTLAGSVAVTGHVDGTGNAARFNYPSAVALDGSGNAYVSDTTNNTIRKITPAGVVTTLAGLFEVSGSSDGTGNAALFNHPGGLTIDAAGNLYVADTGNSTIRKITAAGQVTTLAGLPGVAGLEDGSGTALFNQPRDLTLDASGNLYVADTGNAAIRKISPQGAVTTLTLDAAPASGGDAGTGGNGGSTGGGSSGGPSTPSPSSSSGGGGSIGGGFIAALLGLGTARLLTARKQ